MREGQAASLSRGEVEIAFESPDQDDARDCLGHYFQELAARFETGFDAAADSSAPFDDLVPPKGAFVMARLGGRAIGIGALKKLDSQTGEVKRVWVSPEARGLGVARRILRALEACARERSFSRIRLDTNRALTEAHAFYLGEGYREIARYNDNPHADHWFEKAL